MNIIANATLAVACEPYDFQRFEGGSTVDFDCSAERAPEGALISGDWEPTGGTQSLANLVAPRWPHQLLWCPHLWAGPPSSLTRAQHPPSCASRQMATLNTPFRELRDYASELFEPLARSGAKEARSLLQIP